MAIQLSNIPRSRRNFQRHGLTLVEMLFAIAILLVGMVGIASVLGSAGRNAVRSRTLAESQAVANSAFDTFLAYEMNRQSNWDPYVNWGYRGVWIDPIGRSVSGNNNLISNANGQILRVSLRINGVTVSPKVAERIFFCNDDPAIQKEGDSTLPVSRLFESFATGVSAKSSSQQVYSWFPMLLMNQRMSNRGLLSIVVLKNRDFDSPATQVSVRPLSGSFDTETSSSLRVLIDNVPSGFKIKSGDWILLSTPLSITTNSFDSWYRILNASAEPVEGTNTFSATLTGRSLPVFPSPLPSGQTCFMSGTMLEGVVAVHERVVDIVN